MTKKKLSKLKIGLIQNPITVDDLAGNAKVLHTEILKVIKQKASVLVLPEAFLGGPHDVKKMAVYAQVYQTFVTELCSLAKKHKVHFYGSIIEKEAQKFYNSSVWIDAKGEVIHTYRKIHLFRHENEHKKFHHGNSHDIIETPWGKVAPIICYDLRFPELLRSLTLKGARFALVCAQWPEARRHHWLTLLTARAIENQMVVIGVNRTGTKGPLKYLGDSVVISPWGKTLLHLGPKTKSGVFEIDLSEVESVRKAYPFLEDAGRVKK